MQEESKSFGLHASESMTSASTQQASILTFAIVDTEKGINQKVFYHLEIISDIACWKIIKRFSDFEALSNYVSNRLHRIYCRKLELMLLPIFNILFFFFIHTHYYAYYYVYSSLLYLILDSENRRNFNYMIKSKIDYDILSNELWLTITLCISV